MGDKNMEGIFHGNLGYLYYRMHKNKQAKMKIEHSIKICDEIYPLGSGVFRGTLSLIEMRENNLEAALHALMIGEPLVESCPEEWGKFLCKKAQVFSKIKTENEANAPLQQAVEIAKKLKLNPNSQLSILIQETRSLLNTTFDIR